MAIPNTLNSCRSVDLIMITAKGVMPCHSPITAGVRAPILHDCDPIVEYPQRYPLVQCLYDHNSIRLKCIHCRQFVVHNHTFF